MRARWLKPEFFTDKKIAALGAVVALVYEGLWVLADDGGTAMGDADTIKAALFYRWPTIGVPDISEALRLLSEIERISTYRVGDDEYHRIIRFPKHQKVHKPSKFRHPKPPQALTHDGSGTVPHSPGSGSEDDSASPPPRHLDTKTPRHPEGSPGALPNDTPSAESAWENVLECLPLWHRKQFTAEYHAALPEGSKRGLSKIGGFQVIAATTDEKRVWLRKDFIAAYNSVTQ